MDNISVVIPCYNEEECLPIFYKEIDEVSKSFTDSNFEFIFIDDGSSDKTLSILKDLNKKDKRVKFLSFSRNFGKDAAIYAGLKEAKGDYIGVMDVDMQDPPNMLVNMYDVLKNEDYDIAASKSEGFKLDLFIPNLIYKLSNKINKTEIVSGARDYRLMKKNVVNAILSMNEYNRLSKCIFGFVGFKTKWLVVDKIDRVAGKSKNSVYKSTVQAIESIFSFSTAPLFLSFGLGLFISLMSFINFIIKIIVKAENLSFTFLIFVTGIMMLCFSISTLYLAKTYNEVLKRPIYIVKENEEGII